MPYCRISKLKAFLYLFNLSFSDSSSSLLFLSVFAILTLARLTVKHDLTLRVPSAHRHVRHDKAAPFDRSQILYEPWTKHHWCLHCFILGRDKVRGNHSCKLGAQEEWRREALDTDVKHAVHRCFDLLIGALLKSCAHIDYYLVVHWLDGLILAIDLYLQTRVAKSGKQGDKATV